MTNTDLKMMPLYRNNQYFSFYSIILVLILSLYLNPVLANDITYNVFGKITDGMPAAFGDFDSDKFTDLFVLRDSARTVEILLGDDTEPYLRQSGDNLKCTFREKQRITSVVPGDFDGDAFMDVLVTVRKQEQGTKPHVNEVYILWGSNDKLICNNKDPLFKMYGEPLAMDWNHDMIIDLFGLDENGTRMFWIFKNNRTMKPEEKPMNISSYPNKTFQALKMPHSHAFLDLNGDSYADLYLTTANRSFEVWIFDQNDFVYHKTIYLPHGLDVNQDHYFGQTIFQDMALEGKLNHVIPVCFDNNNSDRDCKNSTIYIYNWSSDKWHNIKVRFGDWQLIHPNGREGGKIYLETLTLRAGDFNMDGYPDLLATLTLNGQYRTYLLENVECDIPSECDYFPRTFKVHWDALSPYNNNTVLGVFYDFLQDGILDIIFVHDRPKQSVSAFRNNLDYDANFLKVIVLTGLSNKNKPAIFNTPLGKKQRMYGTNLPGPTILYSTTTQEGNPKTSISAQLPQSAHFSLNLPYTIFGLGRTPNFIDDLMVSVYGHHRNWTQLIPNSQMVVIPSPPYDPSQWKVQLFVTPSKLIVLSVFALLGTCALISLIIGALYWKERKEDLKEKLQEAQKFHFDAM